ncbi:MAG: cellulase family glycosylhydrolase [Anaerolineae bacterium]|nr:cellulase family glycosylhydrolase [Anaerolineae bacterium]
MQAGLRFGVNYTPSQSWWYCWLDWDRRSIEADLRAVARLGMDHIRIHCLWPYFQPEVNHISATALSRLEAMLDIAGNCGLDVQVTVLNGWLSGFTFRPVWQRDRNMFTDPDMIEAEKRLFSALAERIGGHPHFLGFDLGNELGVLQFYNGESVTVAEADDWQMALFAHCETVAPGKMHVNGVDHVHWFRNAGFSRAALASLGTLTSVHAWIGFTGFLDRYGAFSNASLGLAEYSIELAKAYHCDPQRRVWVQEFGAQTAWMDEARFPEFAEQTIRRAATCGGLWGLTWWSSHDLPRHFRGFDPGEYINGLLSPENSVKPVGARVAELIAEFRSKPPETLSRPMALVLPDTLIDATGQGVWRLADAFARALNAGIHPAIVLESRSKDAAHLRARGIEALMTID